VTFLSPAGVKAAGEWIQKENVAVWNIAQLLAGQEISIRCSITFPSNIGPTQRRQIGPVSMHFNVPGWSASGFQVKYLQVLSQGIEAKPQRWVRYATSAASYVQRL